jgi:hypothetical protein
MNDIDTIRRSRALAEGVVTGMGTVKADLTGKVEMVSTVLCQHHPI